MYDKLKILHHSHTGRLRPHQHTSYLPLAFLVAVAGIVLGFATFRDLALATPTPGPTAGSIGLSGTMPAPPPKLAATIDSPTNQEHFKDTPITVTGTCPDNTLVEIFKNQIFAGSTPCDNGKYSLKVDLLYGKNDLVAQVYDALNQAGPPSATVTVFYDALPTQSAPVSFLDLSGAQLVLNTDAVYRGSSPGDTISVPVTILGGTPPFAVNINWGDTSNKLIPQGANGVFNATHVYKKPGTFEISMQGSDSKQLVAYLQVAAIVNGQPSTLAASVGGGASGGSSKLLVLWPILAIAATTVVSFWIGEKREKRLLSASGALQPPAFNLTPQPHQ